MMIFVFDRLENVVGKEENTGYQHFLLFPQFFQTAFYPESSVVGIVWQRVKTGGNWFDPGSVYFFSRAEPHGLLGTVVDLRTGGRWFDPRLSQYAFRGSMIVIATDSSITSVRYFVDGYVGKQPEAWIGCSAEYLLKELQESMDRCTGSTNITVILLKTVLNTIQSVSQSFRRLMIGIVTGSINLIAVYKGK